jgi:transcriptional regulator of arginine metabolism
MNTLARRQHLRDLLENAPVTSQHDLVHALAADGITVTQTTVSRDLAAIGAVKTRAGYALNSAPFLAGAIHTNGAAVSGALRHHAVNVAQADAMVVIRTAPGHAPLVADAMDKSVIADVVGTIAGDDTIFAATTSRTAAARVAKYLCLLLDGSESGQ